MVRTKDLLLIIIVVVMLLMAISATVGSRLSESKKDELGLGTLPGISAPTYEVQTPSDEVARSQNIDRLKSLLAKGDVIEASPSVEAPSASAENLQNSGSLPCSEYDSGIAVARSWPLSGVEFKTVGVTRVVTKIDQTLPPTSPSTVSTTRETAGLEEKQLLRLPIAPAKQADPICLDSEIVGVTLDGSLIFNSDATLYKNTPSTVLIGYARDGFPIYGSYVGELDQCGGYEGTTGYRYAVSSQRSTVLDCYLAPPQTFSQ